MRASVILNAHGKTIADAGPAELRDRIAAAFELAQIQANIALVGGAQVEVTARKLISDGLLDDEMLVIGGGDGSVGTVAGILAHRSTALGVLPLGTLNHFAKDL